MKVLRTLKREWKEFVSLFKTKEALDFTTNEEIESEISALVKEKFNNYNGAMLKGIEGNHQAIRSLFGARQLLSFLKQQEGMPRQKTLEELFNR